MAPADILEFWFEPSHRARWFRSTDAFDAQIRTRFEEVAINLAAGVLTWENTPEALLAKIIALDQFPRNMYRGTRAAYAWDDKALHLAKAMVEKGWDLKTPQERRAFIYMPFMHAEDLEAQNMCVKLCDSRLDNASTLHHSIEHRKLIERFGRFPHRNSVLGRAPTNEEIAFLEGGGYSP